MTRKERHQFLERPELGVILDSIPAGVLTVNRDFIITSFNRAAEQITGFSAMEAIGQRCYNIFRAPFSEEGGLLADAMRNGRAQVGVEYTILNRRNQEIPVSVTCAALRNYEGEIIGAVETFRDLTMVESLRREVNRQYTLHDMISKNHRMQELFNLVRDIADTGVTVTVLGETGTGKELLARALHAESRRREGPFIKVNCGALPDTLLESELFGHVAGAFTDAKQPRKGRFELARGGSLFLDEIGDTSPAMQVKLLRVLQEGKFEPVGSSGTRTTDARVITATNRDLKALVATDKFREDLYYRINTVVLRVPPLRERRDDIPVLIEHFVQRFNCLYGRNVRTIAEDAMRALLNYDWPGNVREVEHAIEHAFAVVKGESIAVRDLPEDVARVATLARDRSGPQAGAGLAATEQAAIQAALTKHRGNKVAACRELGISRTTLWRKIRQYGLTEPSG